METAESQRCEACRRTFSSRALYESHLRHGCCDKLRRGLFHSCQYCDPTVKSFADSLGGLGTEPH